jgi:hypothetical protein
MHQNGNQEIRGCHPHTGRRPQYSILIQEGDQEAAILIQLEGQPGIDAILYK